MMNSEGAPAYMDTISVLVVDDSALMRNLVSRMIEHAPDMTVVGKAMNGDFALQKIPMLKPDVIILDLEMPKMNGLEFLEERRKQGIDVPVIILSSIARKGAKVTMDALAMGAADFVTKPSGSISTDIHVVADHVQALIRAYGGRYARSIGKDIPHIPPEDAVRQVGEDVTQPASPAPSAAPAAEPPVETEQPPPQVPVSPDRSQPAPDTRAHGFPPFAAGPLPSRIELIAIGISTGGPNALRKMLAAIDRGLEVPIIIVQHMPAGFTYEFAKSLDRICPLSVKEAEDGDALIPGRILISPGNYHIEVSAAEKKVVRLSSAAPENGHRPSADVLFRSAAAHFGNRCMAVIMTGMGRDGAREIGTLYQHGAITLAQDPASCVVYGMPKVAFDAGYIRRQVPLAHMADMICTLAASPKEVLQA